MINCRCDQNDVSNSGLIYHSNPECLEFQKIEYLVKHLSKSCNIRNPNILKQFIYNINSILSDLLHSKLNKTELLDIIYTDIITTKNDFVNVICDITNDTNNYGIIYQKMKLKMEIFDYNIITTEYHLFESIKLAEQYKKSIKNLNNQINDDIVITDSIDYMHNITKITNILNNHDVFNDITREPYEYTYNELIILWIDIILDTISPRTYFGSYDNEILSIRNELKISKLSPEEFLNHIKMQAQVRMNYDLSIKSKNKLLKIEPKLQNINDDINILYKILELHIIE